MKAKTVFLAIGLWLLAVLFCIGVSVALSHVFFSSIDLVDLVTSPVSMANESFDDIESGVKAFEKKVKATPHNSRRTACLNLIPSACPKNLGKATALPQFICAT